MKLNITYWAGTTLLLAVQHLHGAIEPTAGTWKTWVIANGSSHRVQAPPADADTQNELGELKRRISQRAPADIDAIHYWNSGSPAYRWIQIAQREVTGHGLGGPGATRAMSLVAAAMNDAMVAAWDSKYAYNRPRPSQLDASISTAIPVPDSPSYPSEHLTAAGAASAVLSYLFPERKAAFDSLVAADRESRLSAGTEFASDVTAGFALGQLVGQDVIAWAQSDGSSAKFAGSFPPSPGVWSGSNPSFPLAGTWRTWALPFGSYLRLDPPPAFGSPAMAAQIAGVKDFDRTVDTTRIAWVWQASFIDPWVDTVNWYLFESGLSNDPPKAAQVYALALLAQHDATIACWDTKYAYLELRPPQADSQITPLFPLPAHPSYPSGHACASGAAAGVLSSVFPASTAYFLDRAREGGLSTFYAGIHYLNDVDTGISLGISVAHFVLQRGGLADAGAALAPKTTEPTDATTKQ
jgi:membrane-associated phospholipid phosphatase